jgi:hypothetical protein
MCSQLGTNYPQDKNKRYMAQKVVHLENQPAKHETENCVRDVIRMDWDLYER